jgi:hypothetical protein
MVLTPYFGLSKGHALSLVVASRMKWPLLTALFLFLIWLLFSQNGLFWNLHGVSIHKKNKIQGGKQFLSNAFQFFILLQLKVRSAIVEQEA